MCFMALFELSWRIPCVVNIRRDFWIVEASQRVQVLVRTAFKITAPGQHCFLMSSLLSLVHFCPHSTTASPNSPNKQFRGRKLKGVFPFLRMHWNSTTKQSPRCFTLLDSPRPSTACLRGCFSFLLQSACLASLKGNEGAETVEGSDWFVVGIHIAGQRWLALRHESACNSSLSVVTDEMDRPLRVESRAAAHRLEYSELIVPGDNSI